MRNIYVVLVLACFMCGVASSASSRSIKVREAGNISPSASYAPLQEDCTNLDAQSDITTCCDETGCQHCATWSVFWRWGYNATCYPVGECLFPTGGFCDYTYNCNSGMCLGQ